MIEREYAVRVMGNVEPSMIKSMHEGVRIDSDIYRFTDIQYFGGDGLNRWYHVVVMTGRNREVRKPGAGVWPAPLGPEPYSYCDFQNAFVGMPHPDQPGQRALSRLLSKAL